MMVVLGTDAHKRSHQTPQTQTSTTGPSEQTPKQPLPAQAA